MAINRVEIKDFLVFKGDFGVDFCSGVNVIIGKNGTGKTTLMKTIYNGYSVFRGDTDTDNANDMRTVYLSYFAQRYSDIMPELFSDIQGSSIIKEKKYNTFALYFQLSPSDYSEPVIAKENMRKVDINAVYIPEKDILEHARGLLTFIEDKQTGFGQIYKDVLVKAMDTQTQIQSSIQKSVGQIIVDTIGGTIHWDKGEGSFYTLRTDGNRIPFASEASGFKKLGFLGLLVASGQLRPGTVLLWDEPENSLNPELIPVLVNILLDLSRNGVQVLVATHNYSVARYFDVRKSKDIPVLFHKLSKTDTGQIECYSSPEYIKLPNNHMENASENLFKAVVSDGFGIWEDEDE